MEEKLKTQEKGTREKEQGTAEAPFVLPPSSLPVIVRAYRPADYPAVLRLWEEANLKPFTPVEIERLMGAGGNALVATRQATTKANTDDAAPDTNINDEIVSNEVVSNEVVGIILWSHNGSIGILWRLAVDAQARGLGIATRLLDRAEQEIRDIGLSGVSLLTRTANEIARGMYARRGYKWSDHLEFWGKRLSDPEEKPAA